MIKILYIIPSLRKGGAERLVIDICNQLYSTSNVEIKLICFSDKNEYPDLAVADFIKVIPSSVSLSFAGKNNLQINELQEELNSFQPDIIHSHLFEAEIVSRSCYYPQAKWFSHCHDNMVQFENLCLSSFTKKTKLTNYYEKKYLFDKYKINGGTSFIAIGNDTKNYFNKTAKPYTTIKLANAIDYNKFYRIKQIEEKKQIIITNTGSFVNKKNQAFILEIANVLKTKGVDFKINLLGDGPNLNTLVKKTKGNNLTNQIIYHGKVNNVQEFLWNSDIYLHTATYEPLGLVLIEAMASGLPVITLDGKGNRDLIEPGKNGYMIYEQNAELFAQTIIDLWNDKQKYREMSEYAQEFAKQYDIKPYVEKLLRLYQNAINLKE
ncbi:MAG: glycosyltransferase family 4 protein [Bacteroidales bacterium]|nr:glycosyltransferase family 4 protein [Bacteroidales bacterium]